MCPFSVLSNIFPTSHQVTTTKSTANSPNDGGNAQAQASVVTATFSLATYMYAVWALVSWWLFLVPNTFLPDSVVSLKLYSMETSPRTSSVVEATIHNVGQMFIFGFVHSVLARKVVKKKMNLPRSIERSVFVLQGSLLLHMIQHRWLDVETGVAVWNLSSHHHIVEIVLGLFWFGAGFLLSATFALDHFHLFGLSQGFGIDINKKLGLAFDPFEHEGCMKTRWHYSIVAHPIMTGMFLNLWCTPIMTYSRFVCACFLSSYILIGVLMLEENTLRLEIGKQYDQYLSQTPRFFPFEHFLLHPTVHHEGTKKIM
mmetsp:Transcript_11129/g.26410  ORF Transcript_11129/g.26410 Transcript_11129/m.26410 type:complete len:313 (+) Transcript_11129:403-1341(+)